MLRIKRVVTNFLLSIIGRVRLPFNSGRLLIVRFDAIGDYVLFRNHLHSLLTDDRWKQYKVTFVGNVVFKDIAESFDDELIDEFIWINPSELSNVRFLLPLVLRLKKRRFDVAINPMHSRSFTSDRIVAYSGSKTVIGSLGDLVGYNNSEEKRVADALYDRLVEVPGHSVFEYYRNETFVGALRGKTVQVPLSTPFRRSRHIVDGKINVVLFPGAGVDARRWPASFFADLISAMYNADSNMQFLLAGGTGDIPIADEIKSAVGANIINLAGRTSLTELIDLIGSCDLLISNETSAVHIAAAVGTWAICISNGNHFGRFNPYPTAISEKIITVYPFDAFYSTNEREFTELVEKYRVQSLEDIRLVTVTRVLDRVKENIKYFEARNAVVPPALAVFKNI